MFDAIGGEADIGRASRSCRSGAIDPTRTSVNLTAYVAPANPAGNGSLGRSVSLLGWADMRRREFLGALGGLTAAWPLAARAQQRERMRRIGILVSYAANDPQAQARNAAFLQGLQQLGWTVGHNVEIEYRWSGGNIDDTRKYAAELVALAPDVIFVPGSAAVAALRQATRAVPIVFALVADPVGSGFVDSLARPGGNVTGFSWVDFGIGAKWLELLKEIAPNVTRAAILRDPATISPLV